MPRLFANRTPGGSFPVTFHFTGCTPPAVASRAWYASDPRSAQTERLDLESRGDGQPATRRRNAPLGVRRGDGERKATRSLRSPGDRAAARVEGESGGQNPRGERPGVRAVPPSR